MQATASGLANVGTNSGASAHSPKPRPRLPERPATSRPMPPRPLTPRLRIGAGGRSDVGAQVQVCEAGSESRMEIRWLECSTHGQGAQLSRPCQHSGGKNRGRTASASSG